MQARDNLLFIERTIGYNRGSACGLPVVWGSGDKGFLFSGSWEALVIIFRDLGSKLIVQGIKEALQKVKTEFKKSHLKGKAYTSFHFLKKNCLYRW